ncbi:MAG: hypothetical protein U0931_29955 [Vulcanimicrobiota bacterium]
MDQSLLQQARQEWQELLNAAEQGDPRCLAYRSIFQAILQEDLARVFPHLSMWTLRLSLCPTYPWDQSGLPEVNYNPENGQQFNLDEGPWLSLSQTLEALRPLLRAAEAYPSEPEED